MATTQNSAHGKTNGNATVQFHQKMSVLNRDLIRFLSKNEFPAADLTPTLNSYIKHVNELDRMYAGVEGEEAPKENSGVPNNVEMLTSKSTEGPAVSKSRKRQLPTSDELRTFDDNKKRREFSAPTTVESTVTTVASASSATSFGSLFGPSTVSSAIDTTAPTTTSQSTPLFGSNLFGKAITSTTTNPAPIFGGSATASKTTVESTVTTTASASSATSFGSLFGPSTVTSPTVTTTAPTTTSQSTPLFGSNLFGKAIASATTNPTPIFGGTATATKSTESTEETPEEVPKVEEVEQKEEGALFSMKTKVFVKKEKTWDPVGIGYVNVMPGDPKKQLLVRAATSIGTIWMNTLIGGQFKAFKRVGPNNKPVITARFPVKLEKKESEEKELVMKEYCFRGGDPGDLEKLSEHLNAHVIS